ncbi:MAG: hypothetical protein ABSB25_06000 [Sedimentisphaerales bacterium]|jgi:hypothetical protein
MAKKKAAESNTVYWVVSPKVRTNSKKVDEWKKASVREHAAFMGYKPNDRKHRMRMGPKFAGQTKKGVKPGDVILIARRHDDKPDIVGFGKVHGEYATKLKGFNPPEDFGSLRKLSPFIPWRQPPSGIPLIGALRHIQSLVQLHPPKNVAHKKVRDWMEQYLGNKNRKAGEKQHIFTRSKDKRKLGLKSAVIVDLPEIHLSDYKFQTKSQLRNAKNIEKKLLIDYWKWLKKEGRKLQSLKYDESLQCDGYEKNRQNLIEAKSSVRREHIRMAVGQLLDYAFLSKKQYGDLNKAILLPKKPEPNIVKWLLSLKISIIWCDRGKFRDNAKGQFS